MDKESQLDVSQQEIVTLSQKLEMVLRQRELDQSVSIQDAVTEETNALRNSVTELENTLCDTINSYKGLLPSHNNYP